MSSNQNDDHYNYFEFMNSWPDWVRWILVLPGAIGGFIIFEIIGAVASFLAGLGGDEYRGSTKAFFEFLMSASFIFGGASTAPRFKEAVGLILSLIPIGLCVWLYELAQQHSNKSDSAYYLIFLIMSGVVIGNFIIIKGLLAKRKTSKSKV